MKMSEFEQNYSIFYAGLVEARALSYYSDMTL